MKNVSEETWTFGWSFQHRNPKQVRKKTDICTFQDSENKITESWRQDVAVLFCGTWSKGFFSWLWIGCDATSITIIQCTATAEALGWSANVKQLLASLSEHISLPASASNNVQFGALLCWKDLVCDTWTGLISQVFWYFVHGHAALLYFQIGLLKLICLKHTSYDYWIPLWPIKWTSKWQVAAATLCLHLFCGGLTFMWHTTETILRSCCCFLTQQFR